MSSFRIRRAERADADAATAIVRALDTAILGESDFTLADLEDEWRALEPERNAFLVCDGDVPVAYGTVDDRGDPSRADGYVHPEHFGRGAGTALVRALEDELRARGEATVRNGVLLADGRAHELLRGEGYREVRRFSQMRIELDAAPPLPSWPEGVRVAPFKEADGERFHAAYEDAFADHWGHTRRPFEEWRADHMSGDDYAPELWTVVRADGEIVAGSMLIRERHGVAWVSRLFTVRDWRRRGLGEALLHDAFGTFWRQGRNAVGLGVDAQSETGANRLYERAGMHAHWGAVVFEKDL
ncbi:MAG TPA: GNAT family N-acetyltransferase [Gaiellaceae bacterium]|nr:GNAT family N-acetyltransferase [Gaiellaceae bacterium]